MTSFVKINEKKGRAQPATNAWPRTGGRALVGRMALVYNASPYDALLLVSFGGPESPDQVLPFLERVSAGRVISRSRLLEVADHYYRFGGRSPINDQNRAFLAAVESDFAAAGLDLPVYWGNRNSEPFLS